MKLEILEISSNYVEFGVTCTLNLLVFGETDVGGGGRIVV